MRIPERQIGIRDAPGLYIGFSLIIVEMALAVWFDAGPVAWLARAGGILWLVGVFLLAAPIWWLARHGGVAKGDSFLDTTRVVDTGPFAVVRHPQYLGWITVAIALPIRTQRWEVAAIGVVAVGCLVTFFRTVDTFNTRIFGSDYERYMARVPGWNPLVGLWRLASRRARGRSAEG